MKRWAAIAAFLFLGAQFSAGLHAALEAGHDLHECCTDDVAAAHFDSCGANHDAPPCEICAAGRAPFTATLDFDGFAFERVELPSTPAVVTLPSDPFQVQSPGSRGPPA